MWLLDWLSRTPPPAPRTYEEIRAEVAEREDAQIQRLNRTEDSLLSLTAEAGLEDLSRRLENLRAD